MSQFKLDDKIEIDGRTYIVGYVREIQPGIISLGLLGTRGATYTTDYFVNEDRFSVLIRI